MQKLIAQFKKTNKRARIKLVQIKISEILTLFKINLFDKTPA